MIIYDHVEPVFYSSAYMFKILPGWLRNLVSDQQQHSMRDYEYRAKNLLRHVGYQAMGRASGVHGLFHQCVIHLLRYMFLILNFREGFE
jgi:glycosylphosphatidylinositol transamidase